MLQICSRCDGATGSEPRRRDRAGPEHCQDDKAHGGTYWYVNSYETFIFATRGSPQCTGGSRRRCVLTWNFFGFFAASLGQDDGADSITPETIEKLEEENRQLGEQILDRMNVAGAFFKFPSSFNNSFSTQNTDHLRLFIEGKLESIRQVLNVLAQDRTSISWLWSSRQTRLDASNSTHILLWVDNQQWICFGLSE